MFVSVVIATRNRSALLEQTLRTVVDQEWPADLLEVIVADNGSTDATRTVVEATSARQSVPVRYLFVPEPGKSHAVNAALRLARGELIALTDDDVQPEPTWVASLARAAQERGADFVAGRILPIWEVAPPAWMSPALFGVLAIPENGDVPLSISADGPTRVMPIGANMAVRASVVARIGGLRTDLGKLDGSLRTGEDHEFFLRLLQAGCQGVYEPSAVVRHLVPASRLRRSYFRSWLHQNGRDVALLERAYPSPVPTLFGVPRYLWRQTAADLIRTIGALFTCDSAQRFASSLQLLWFAGYLRGAWFGDAALSPPELTLAEGR